MVLAHLKTLETRGDEAARRAWKVRLVKHLYERGLRARELRLAEDCSAVIVRTRDR